MKDFFLKKGLRCGEWLSFGGPDLPADQTGTFHQAATFVSEPLEVKRTNESHFSNFDFSISRTIWPCSASPS